MGDILGFRTISYTPIPLCAGERRREGKGIKWKENRGCSKLFVVYWFL
jgi:hypothetical protein